MPDETTPVHKLPLPPDIIARCRGMRQNCTNAESLLWLFLRNRGLKNAKFRRQHPLGRYVLDFYCHEIHLAIELDGSGHLETSQMRHDHERTEYLIRCGIRELRFYNDQVLGNIEDVLSVIWEVLPDLPSLSTDH